MKRALGALGLAAWALQAHPAMAQQEIQWKQTVNMPKGVNMPPGVKAEILGIEMGDTYAESKPKLAALAAEDVRKAPTGLTPTQQYLNESSGVAPVVPLKELTTQIRFNAPGGMITARYVGEVQVVRELKGAGRQNISDSLRVFYSAPSSGQQVIGIVRTIGYFENGDQPRISEVMANLKAKFKAEPQLMYANRYRFQFDNGHATASPKSDPYGCQPNAEVPNEQAVARINPKGTCDVVLTVEFSPGISQDHARRIIFYLADNERTKTDVGADFAYFGAYVRGQQGGKGVAPKL